MTVNIVYLSNNMAEKRKIKEIKYPLLDQFYDIEDEKVEDVLKIMELEERYNVPPRLA